MATVRDITTMCRAGHIQEAYDLAKSDLELNPNDVWTQREMGWSLYYLIRNDAENGQYDQLLAHIDELQSLDQLNLTNDAMIFENVIFWIGYFAKKRLLPTGIDTPTQLSTLFSKLKEYTFTPSNGYSFLLEGFIKCDSWQELLEFMEWWNLDNLRSADYMPVELNNGRTIKITLAERAYIAKSKALLRKKDCEKINEFLPELDALMTKHPEMMYPGYFYGKLLLSTGNNPTDALRVVVPFARKKSTEFWVWQLLSDVFVADKEKQLACLLRAVNCNTKEDFLRRVRIKLADFYILSEKYDLARNQIDKVTRNCLSQGQRIPYQIECWIHQPWFDAAIPKEEEDLDYMSITNEILGEKREEAIAIVTYINPETERALMIYGYKKRMSQKVKFEVESGSVLKINYVINSEGKQRLLKAKVINLPNNLQYAKMVEGTIKKKADKAFASLHYGENVAFITPNVVSNYKVEDGEAVKALIVFDFDKKRNDWSWVVIKVNRLI